MSPGDLTLPFSRRKRWIAGWLLLTLLVAFAARDIEWAGAARAAAQADVLWLILAGLMNGAILLLTAIQWLIFVPRGETVPLSTMFRATAISSAVSNSAPLLAGQAVGIQLLATEGGVGYPVATSVTLLDQVAEGLAKLTLIVVLIWGAPVAWAQRSVPLVLVLGVPALLIGSYWLAHSARDLDGLSARGPQWARGVVAAMARLAHGLEAIRTPRTFALGVAMALGQKLIEALAIWAVAAAFGVTLTPWETAAVLAAVSFSTMVTLAPGNVGVYEGSAVLVYVALGLERDAALGLALVQHALYLLAVAGPGWVLATTGWLSRPSKT
jgi:uncharacterized protein (TIRG00374 family)